MHMLRVKIALRKQFKENLKNKTNTKKKAERPIHRNLKGTVLDISNNMRLFQEFTPLGTNEDQ